MDGANEGTAVISTSVGGDDIDGFVLKVGTVDSVGCNDGF